MEIITPEAAMTFHTADTSNFLQELLSVSEADVARVKSALQEKYGADISLFAELAICSDELEAKVYSLFADAANAVIECYDSADVHSTWIPRSSAPTDPTAEKPSLIRPDAAATLKRQRPCPCADDPSRSQDADIFYTWDVSIPLNIVAKLILTCSKLEVSIDSMWLHATTPVEIKPTGCWGSGQILLYMKQVLETQLDRRFVFGLLIRGHQLRVFYDDRTGLLATEGWIDIQKVRRRTPLWRPVID